MLVLEFLVVPMVAHLVVVLELLVAQREHLVVVLARAGLVKNSVVGLELLGSQEGTTLTVELEVAWAQVPI